MTARAGQGRAAFTLVELLVVVAILSILVGGLAQALNSLASSNRIHPAALEFAAAVREARAAAMRENALVRLTFVTPAMRRGSSGVALPSDMRAGYGLFIFKVPAHGLSGSVQLQPTLEIESDSGLRESVPTARVPITRSLLGAWQALDGFEHWSVRNDQIEVRGNVADAYLTAGFSQAQLKHLWQPTAYWTDGYNADATGDSVYVEFPRSFARTPCLKRVQLVSEAPRVTETV
ncbi:MAG: type II secretion system protein, partial [Verrucomicrobium sp.]